MNLNIKILFLIIQILFLSGCTFGSLTSDQVDLNKNFTPLEFNQEVYVMFKSLPGEVSASSYSGVVGSFTATVDADPIAKNMALSVFSLKFKNLKLIAKLSELTKSTHRLEIVANAETSSKSGAHIAKLSINFIDQNNNILFNAKTEQTVYDPAFAQTAPMRRAFYRAYHNILRKIETYTRDTSNIN